MQKNYFTELDRGLDLTPIGQVCCAPSAGSSASSTLTQPFATLLATADQLAEADMTAKLRAKLIQHMQSQTAPPA